MSGGVIIKSQDEVDIMREAGQIVARALDLVEEMLQPGVTTGELDAVAEKFIVTEGGVPAFKGYKGFTGTLCTSVNEEIVHGIPGDRVLQDGDILSVDVGVKWKGYYGDSARTLAVGQISEIDHQLLTHTKESLMRGVEAIRPGGRLFDICAAIENYVRPFGYGIVEEFVGHGIGQELHEAPQIPNYVDKTRRMRDLELKTGMVLAIEPMLNLGVKETRKLNDGWTIVTRDGQRSAHFEHTVAVTDSGFEILTAANSAIDSRN